VASVPSDSSKLRRISRILLLLASLFASVTFILAFTLYQVTTRPIGLEQLNDEQRLRLVRQAERIVPPMYEPYLGVPAPGFYRFRPDTSYDRRVTSEGIPGLVDAFTTNELGFRSIRLAAKTSGRRRLVVVGDSWTFGPEVRFDEVFTQQLQGMLDRAGPSWEVVNLGMMGWNTANELAALRVLLPTLKPDLVVICPTSNDIDDSYVIWNGRLVRGGFDSGAIFRHSYEYERRWVEAFRHVQATIDDLRAHGIGTLVYFLAEWRGLAPYYARMAGFTAPYAVVPTAYIEGNNRLPLEIDPGGHASPKGHRLIAAYLYNALLQSGLVRPGKPIPLDHAVEFPGTQYVAAAVERELSFWRRLARTPNLVAAPGDQMRLEAMLSLPARPGITTVVADLELLDLPGLYPLRVRVDVLSPDAEGREQVFARYAPGLHRVEIPKPRSLDRYDFVEVRVRADRVVAPPDSVLTVSMKKPKVLLR
jgi:lysophospholipase L1-like esterase